ncbi:MAG: hypothetical protein B6226_04980 [Candidatus Cloacimonetes bacterium 4572_65]|nr:MAG: hypothetical protein B6226_04980 [Candidatus Cloacimonetes bacterium 4572_65]
MKKIILIIGVMIVALALNAEIVDRIIAKVGDDIILDSDLQKQLMQMKAGGSLPENETEETILLQMVEFKLAIQKAKELDYVVDKSQVNELANNRLKEIRANFATETEFLTELKKNNMNKYDLLNYFRELLEEQSLREQVVHYEIENKIEVSDEEIQEYYDEHRIELPLREPSNKLGMILIQIKASDSTKKKRYAECEDILERLNRGESFEDVAKSDSDGPSSVSGGDLGYFARGDMVKGFEKAAFALKPGEVSDIVETQFGYHIIKLEGIKENKIRARHILKELTPNRIDSLAVYKLMERITTKFNEGEDFGQLAFEYSDDQQSALDRGVIGIFPKGEFPPLYQDYYKNLDTGEISDIILIEDMYYIFANLEDVPAGVFELYEIKDEIKRAAHAEKREKFYNNWINKLKEEIYFEITY